MGKITRKKLICKASIGLEWTRGAGCASGEGSTDPANHYHCRTHHCLLSNTSLSIVEHVTAYCWTHHWTLSITLLTQYHLFGPLFSRYFDYNSISLLQNRLEKKNRTLRMDGRTHRIWPDLEAPGTTPRNPKRLPVTARSLQKGTHKSPSNSLNPLAHIASKCVKFHTLSNRSVNSI